jgi:tetratricopeptide (TPR) repeat protein
MSAIIRLMAGTIALAVATLCLGPPARAQTQEQLSWCKGENGATPDRQISGCTAVIQSGKFQGKNLATAFSLRGGAYSKKKDWDRAIADHSEAIRLDPMNVNAIQQRAFAYVSKEQYDQAIEDFSRLIRMDPTDVSALNFRCWYRTIVGQLQLALKDCNESLRLEPGNPETPGFRGFTHLKLGQFDAAIADYDAYMRLNPSTLNKALFPLFGRGFAKRKKGDVTGGDTDIAAAKTINPNVADIFARYGVK